LYRAIDSAGATIDFLLSEFRDADAANVVPQLEMENAFFR
jgi:transposase-like protein